MIDVNYVIAFVKILETPKKINLDNKNISITCRAQLVSSKNTEIVYLLFWDKLEECAIINYKINDYILVEGYISLRLNNITNFTNIKPIKKTFISVIKNYPFSDSLFK